MKMKRLTSTLIVGGILFGSPIHSRAEPYELVSSIVYKNQKANKETLSISYPLIVDLVYHTLTVPKHVIGYTLILESENGETCTYIITDTVFILPQELSGYYQLSISNDSIMYKGSIYVN